MQPQTYNQMLRPIGAVLCSRAGCSERLTGKFRYCEAHLPPRARPEKPLAKKPSRTPTGKRLRITPLDVSEKRIVEQLERCGGAAHNLMLLKATKASVSSASKAINNLLAQGVIAKVRRGVYCFADRVEWGSTYRYPHQAEVDERVLAVMPVGVRVAKSKAFKAAGSLHSGRLSISRLRRLGRIEFVSTKTIRRLS